MKENYSIDQVTDYFTELCQANRIKNMQMPGDPRYQPKELQKYLGYDMWASWLIIVEWFWMLTLAKCGIMRKTDASYLTISRLFRLLRLISTTMQDLEEKNTKHDILALLNLMRKYLPKALHKWLHFGATSYDIINTAYALQIHATFNKVFWPKLCEVDDLWRKKIKDFASILQAGRTHLQTALPITVGFWLACLHNRFVDSSKRCLNLANEVPGKFSGAVGTKASQRALMGSLNFEKVLMDLLQIPAARLSTQITPPEPVFRFYSEIVALSGSMANFGDDVRILQASQFGELMSTGSSSSAMPHKTANPILAENVAGMHVSVIAEFMKPVLTLTSNLQRDLRNSNVMRSYSAALVFAYKQVETTGKILKSMTVNKARCKENFEVPGGLIMAELLHLSLQQTGYANSHHFINKEVLPIAKNCSDLSLVTAIKQILEDEPDTELERAWEKIPPKVKGLLLSPQDYLGDAIEIANNEALNSLRR